MIALIDVREGKYWQSLESFDIIVHVTKETTNYILYYHKEVAQFWKWYYVWISEITVCEKTK